LNLLAGIVDAILVLIAEAGRRANRRRRSAHVITAKRIDHYAGAVRQTAGGNLGTGRTGTLRNTL
jgi:hypothetical protein